MSQERSTDSEANSSSCEQQCSNLHSKESLNTTHNPLDSGIDNEAFEHDNSHTNNSISELSVNSQTHPTEGSKHCNPDAIEIHCENGERSENVTKRNAENQNKYEASEDGKVTSAVEGGTASSQSEQKVKRVQRKVASLKKWFTGTNFIVYITHFLSAWGDRMWSFGVGLFLVNIASENLQLPAVYGLSSSLTIFFLGALVGDWVDTTPRLKAAQSSLILQNVFVVICAAGVYAYLWFEWEITEVYGEWLIRICHAGIIIFGILANLASMARMIAVERDWIVEICGRDKDMLAKMTASLRRIDQGTLILAPIATGQIMTYVGLENGAIFIAAWNVGSVFIEYYLMWKVYNTVPALKAKKGLCRADETPGNEAVEDAVDEDADKEAETPNDALSSGKEEPLVSDSDKNDAATSTDVVPTEKTSEEEEEKVMETKNVEEEEKEKVVIKDSKKDKKGGCANALICSRFMALYRGWRTYMGYNVRMAGIALSCLYMTVLGFDNITVAYAVTQGVSESILGILMGVSAVFGIVGTFAYPVMRRRLGLVRTGIFALSCQILCLSLCVVSIWMPGSPFDPLFYIHLQDPVTPSCNNTMGVQAAAATSSANHSVAAYNGSIVTPSTLLVTTSTESSNVTDCVTEDEGPESYLSVGLLMAGIVTARFGLWTADLTITQLFLEAVVEGERGVVNGVQGSLNKLMDVIKFIMVVAVPDVETFGYLIIISFAFICLGWLSYAIFLRGNRGHFFHFEKCANGDCGNGRPVPEACCC